MAFPQYFGIFPKLQPIHLLHYWKLIRLHLPLSQQIRRRLLTSLIKSTAHFGPAYSQNKYDAIIQAVNKANNFGYIFESNIRCIRLYISFIRKYDKEITSILDALHELVDICESTDFVRHIYL